MTSLIFAVATGFPQLKPTLASRGIDESSFSVYPKALATFSASIYFDEVMRICDSEQALTSGICTGFCFRAIRNVNGFRDDSVRQRYALLSFGSRSGEATGHDRGGVTTD